jgi:hypothetical protein
MAVERQRVVVKLTMHQVLRCEKLATYLWPQERLDVGEIIRLLLEHLLWQESERNLIESVRIVPQGAVRPYRKALWAGRRRNKP